MSGDVEVVVAAALDDLAAERSLPVDVAAAAHLAIDAAIEAGRIRGARLAIASRLGRGPDPRNLRGLAEQAARAGDRATRAAHEAVDLLVVALGARS